MEKEEKKNYSDTLNLPQTNFSMRANLPTLEPQILKDNEIIVCDIIRG